MTKTTSSERIAMITGAARGIGKAAVAKFLDAGWQVIAVDRAKADNLPSVLDAHQVDLSIAASVEELVERLHNHPGRLDALINNAGVQISKTISDTTLADWDEVMKSNLRSTFLMGKYCLELLSGTHGSVVNVSSVHALATSSSIAAYAASKGGILALTRAMALEYGEFGVRVNAVLPGAVDTQMLSDSLERFGGDSRKARLDTLATKTAIGRIGEPTEIAEAILFLADNKRSSFITGQALVVDGGATARLSTE